MKGATKTKGETKTEIMSDLRQAIQKNWLDVTPLAEKEESLNVITNTATRTSSLIMRFEGIKEHIRRNGETSNSVVY